MKSRNQREGRADFRRGQRAFEKGIPKNRKQRKLIAIRMKNLAAKLEAIMVKDLEQGESQ